MRSSNVQWESPSLKDLNCLQQYLTNSLWLFVSLIIARTSFSTSQGKQLYSGRDLVSVTAPRGTLLPWKCKLFRDSFPNWTGISWRLLKLSAAAGLWMCPAPAALEDTACTSSSWMGTHSTSNRGRFLWVTPIQLYQGLTLNTPSSGLSLIMKTCLLLSAQLPSLNKPHKRQGGFLLRRCGKREVTATWLL